MCTNSLQKMRDIPFLGSPRVLRDRRGFGHVEMSLCQEILPRRKKKLADEKAAGSAKRSSSHAVGYHELNFKDV